MADASPADALFTTPLHDAHLALGAHMTGFGGFDMPVHYTGIRAEHEAVRTAAGLFDVSHMGEVMVRGPEAFAFVQHLVTNDVAKLYDGRALYTVMCQDDGGIVDDLLVYRLADDAYMLVINAANAATDLAWMRDHNPMGAVIEDVSAETALLALQGPAAFGIAQTLTDAPLGDLKYYHFMELAEGAFAGLDYALLSATGYTGERGLEIYCAADDARAVWDALMDAGAAHGLVPAGLGARDTLRLEAGYCLYGQDLTRQTNPLEAGLGWVVKLGASDFVGRDALALIQEHGGPTRRLVGLAVDGRGIPRAGYPIGPPEGDAVIGEVTSGTQSPMLRQGIGLGYVPNDPAYTAEGARLSIAGRRPMAATVVKPPFHDK
jgi:aminomethyltransferase